MPLSTTIGRHRFLLNRFEIFLDISGAALVGDNRSIASAMNDHSQPPFSAIHLRPVNARSADKLSAACRVRHSYDDAYPITNITQTNQGNSISHTCGVYYQLADSMQNGKLEARPTLAEAAKGTSVDAINATRIAITVNDRDNHSADMSIGSRQR